MMHVFVIFLNDFDKIVLNFEKGSCVKLINAILPQIKAYMNILDKDKCNLRTGLVRNWNNRTNRAFLFNAAPD